MSVKPSRYSFSSILLVLCAIVVIAAVGIITFRHLEYTNPKVARPLGAPLPVQVVPVEPGSVNEALGAEGAAKEFQSIPLSALTTGRVDHIHVWLGDVVHKGQALIEMDLGPLRDELKYTKAELDSSTKVRDVDTKNAEIMKKLYDQGFVALSDLNTALATQYQAEVNVAQLSSSVTTSTQNLSYAQINSPVDGVVTDRDVYEGTVLKAATPIMTVGQIDPILVEAPFSEDKARFMYVGQTARVSFYAFPGAPVEGKVQDIKPEVASTRLITVQIRLPNHDLKLLPGMHGIAYLDDDRAQVLRIPSTAVVSTQEDRGYVFVVGDDGKARVRELRLGAYADGYLEVKSGLQKGEQVVVVGQWNLQDGDPVRIFNGVSKQ